MKKLLLFCISLCVISCSHKPDVEVIVTANTNLCPNCYNEYRFLDSISEDCKLHLLFRSTNPNEAQKFSDKFLKISRNYDIICDDTLFKSLSHNIFPWLYLYKDGELVFDAELSQSEKRILCRMERRDGEIRFKSLVDNVFIPEFNEKHGLGTNLCLIKIDSRNAYFNAAPVITNYENGKQIDLPFSNENAHFDLRHGIAESDFILADAVHKSDGDFLLSYYWKKDRKLSLIDSSGNLIWTIHFPKSYEKVYLVDEDWVVFVDK